MIRPAAHFPRHACGGGLVQGRWRHFDSPLTSQEKFTRTGHREGTDTLTRRMLRAASWALVLPGSLGLVWLLQRRLLHQAGLLHNSPWWLRGAWWVRQRLLRRRLIEHDLRDFGAVQLIGGVDISFIKGSDTDACAALIIVEVDTLSVR